MSVYAPHSNSPQDLELASTLVSMRFSHHAPGYVSTRLPSQPLQPLSSYATALPRPSHHPVSFAHKPLSPTRINEHAAQVPPAFLPGISKLTNWNAPPFAPLYPPVPMSVVKSSNPLGTSVTKYTPAERKEAVRRFKEKKKRRRSQVGVVRYQVRKRLADTRPRFRGRFYRPKSTETKSWINKRRTNTYALGREMWYKDISWH